MFLLSSNKKTQKIPTCDDKMRNLLTFTAKGAINNNLNKFLSCAFGIGCNQGSTKRET